MPAKRKRPVRTSLPAQLPTPAPRRAGPEDQEKRSLRKRLFHQLLTQKEGDRRQKSEAIRRQLCRLRMFQRATTVLCYVSLPYEVETRQLIDLMLARGKRVVVPRVRREDLELSELRDPATDLAPGAYGVLEPTTASFRPVRPEELDLVLVPGLAFDRRGHRLGHGLGYFDRFLAQLPAAIPTIGLCYAFQLLDHLPTRPHDQAVTKVLSA